MLGNFIKNSIKNFTGKRGFTTTDLVACTFVLSIAVPVAGFLSYRQINVGGGQKIRAQAVELAEGGLDLVGSIMRTNRRRHADPGCWKTITTEDVCNSSTSPMMAINLGPIEEYSLHFDYIDHTDALLPPTGSGEFEDSAILARETNSFSIHEKYLGPNETKSILSADIPNSKNLYFYRRIRVKAEERDLNGDGDDEEILRVESAVKWPDGIRVKEYVTSRIFMEP